MIVASSKIPAHAYADASKPEKVETRGPSVVFLVKNAMRE